MDLVFLDSHFVITLHTAWIVQMRIQHSVDVRQSLIIMLNYEIRIYLMVFFISVPDRPQIYVEPPNIYKPAWVPFEFVCGSYNSGQISAVFAVNGSRVHFDPRFRVSKFNDSTVVVNAPRGLRDIDDTIIQ